MSSRQRIQDDKKELWEEMVNYSTCILWYIIFLGVIPLLITMIWSFDGLRYYIPFVDMIANTFASVGEDNLFRSLYSETPDDIFTYLSTNLLNLIALTGISWNSLTKAFKFKSIKIGIITAITMYIVTYLLPQRGISYFIYHIHEYFQKFKPIDSTIFILGERVEIFHYLIGFTFVGILILLEIGFLYWLMRCKTI